MAGVKPTFITGANAKIKLNGKTLAFCTDLSYSIQILTQTPKVLGMYEGSSVEPLGYQVSGNFTVVRYAKDIKAAQGGTPAKDLAANDAGNGVGNWGSTWGDGVFKNALPSLGIGNDGRANEALDPSRLAQGATFDIQVYQKVMNIVEGPPGVGDQVASSVQDAADFLGGAQQSGFAAKGGTNLLGVANIRNCRITQADFSISKRGAAVQRFSFVALYVDEDSFVADFSGLGQHFTG